MSKLETLDELGDTDIGTLLSRAHAMDIQAMNDLLERLTPFVWRLCLPIAERHSADATQEAMLAIFRGIGSLHEPRAFYAWVRAVTVRAAVLTSKRLNRSTVSELADSVQEADPYVSTHIRDVISRLPDHHRQVLVLRAVHGMNEEEIAAMLSLPVGTVRSRLHRARRNFRAAWHGAHDTKKLRAGARPPLCAALRPLPRICARSPPMIGSCWRPMPNSALTAAFNCRNVSVEP